MRDWVDLILRVGEEEGFWPGDREVVSTAARFRPGASEVMALRVGHEKLTRETGWQPLVSWEEGVRETIRWYAGTRERWIGRVDWLATGSPTVARATRVVGAHRVADPGTTLFPCESSSPAAAGSSARTSSSGSGPTGTTSSRRGAASYDLTSMDDTARLFADARPELVFHLAAEVGGIGANRANPGRYWYANLVMGAHVLEQARIHGDRQARDRRHGLLVPEAHARAVPRGGPLERLPGGDERAVRRREEGGARRRAGLPRAVRPGRRLPAAREPLRAARQLRPRDLARDPGARPQDARRRRRGRALGRRVADARVPLRRRLRRGAPAGGRALRRRRAGEPRDRARRSRSATWRGSSPR